MRFKTKKTGLFFSSLVFLFPALAKAQDMMGVPEYINNLYMVAVGLAGLAAVIMIVIGAVYFTTSGGNPSKQKEGKEYITSAILGLLLLLGAFILLNTINPQLVKLEDPPTSTPVEVTAPGTGTITGDVAINVLARCESAGTPPSPSVRVRAYRPQGLAGCSIGEGAMILSENVNLNYSTTISYADLEGETRLCSFRVTFSSDSLPLRVEGAQATETTFTVSHALESITYSIENVFIGSSHDITAYYDCGGGGGGGGGGFGGTNELRVDVALTSGDPFVAPPAIPYTGTEEGTITSYPHSFSSEDDINLSFEAPESVPLGVFSRWAGCLSPYWHRTCQVAVDENNSGLTIMAYYQPLFSTGDRVTPITSTTVRSESNSLNQNSLGDVSNPRQGLIDGGPEISIESGVIFVWWLINWDTGLSGWSNQNSLSLVPST